MGDASPRPKWGLAVVADCADTLDTAWSTAVALGPQRRLPLESA